MQILPTELERLGYERRGSVKPNKTPRRFVGSRGHGLFVVDVPVDLSGWVTYVHVMDDQFMKCGVIKPGQSMRSRMRGSYNCLRKPSDLSALGCILGPCWVALRGGLPMEAPSAARDAGRPFRGSVGQASR